ncbi:MAG: hypothetical protein PHS66_06665 [Candidatus Omnitrophica bacterium]|nr:hypothetical protein [Candidatus Omnitrophota bacterium]
MLNSRKAQAILELAVLGSIVIMAFSIAITRSERANRQQSYMQQAFRAALKAAKTINSSAQWQTMDFRRMPNVTNPMELGELQQFSGGNNVLWSDGKKDATQAEPEAKGWFQLNHGSPIEIPVNSEGLYNTTVTSSTSYSSNAHGTTSFDKKENNGSISTRKSLVATDNMSGSADISGTSVDLGSSLGAHGKYTGGGINRSRDMQ